MPDPYSLVDGVGSPIIPLTFSIDNPAIGELVSNDDLQIFFFLGGWGRDKNTLFFHFLDMNTLFFSCI